MAVVIERERAVERPVYVERDSPSSILVAILVLALIVFGAIVWMRFFRAEPATAPQQPGTNINVTLPEAPGGSNTSPETSPASPQ